MLHSRDSRHAKSRTLLQNTRLASVCRVSLNPKLQPTSFASLDIGLLGRPNDYLTPSLVVSSPKKFLVLRR